MTQNQFSLGRPAWGALPTPTAERQGGMLGLAIFAIWVLVVVDGIWTYGSYRLFGGRVLPLSPIFFLALVLAAVDGVIKKKVFVVDQRLFYLSWIFAGYLLAVSMFQAQIDDGFLIIIWRGYYLNYFYILAFPALGMLTGLLGARIAAVGIILLAIGLAAFGSIQHFTHNLFEIGRVIALQSNAFNLGFAGRVRANGLFAHAEDLGFFLSLAAAIVTAQFFQTKGLLRRSLFAVIWIFLAVGCFSTITRAAYIAFAFSSFVAMWFSRKGRSTRVSKLDVSIPIVLFLVAVLLFFARSIISTILSSDVIFSSASLDDRIYGSLYYLRQLEFGGWQTILFGRGWYFLSDAHAVIPLDNGFLGIIVNGGVLALCLWLLMTFGMWRHLLHHAVTEGGTLAKGLVSFFSTWLALSVFNVVSLYQLVAVLFLLTWSKGKK